MPDGAAALLQPARRSGRNFLALVVTAPKHVGTITLWRPLGRGCADAAFRLLARSPMRLESNSGEAALERHATAGGTTPAARDGPSSRTPGCACMCQRARAVAGRWRPLWRGLKLVAISAFAACRRRAPSPAQRRRSLVRLLIAHYCAGCHFEGRSTHRLHPCTKFRLAPPLRLWHLRKRLAPDHDRHNPRAVYRAPPRLPHSQRRQPQPGAGGAWRQRARRPRAKQKSVRAVLARGAVQDLTVHRGGAMATPAAEAVVVDDIWKARLALPQCCVVAQALARMRLRERGADAARRARPLRMATWRSWCRC